MSYQYPPPPSSCPDFKLSPRPIGSFQIPPDPQQQAIDSDILSQEENQQASDQTDKIKRSSSTPNIRGQAAADAALAASAEKRRNKLGYHRTSVACGHCRRRKIRCILAPGDLQNRCANCIRLKKECNFYPVDQPPQPESKGQRAAGSGRGLGRASSSSASPTNQLGRTSEMQDGIPYPNMGMPPYLSSADPKRPKDDGFAPENRGLVFGAPNEYPPNSAVWLQSKVPPSTRPVADASAYWRVNTQEPLLAPAFSMYPQNLNQPQHNNWSPTAVESGHREELSWPVPQRSVSFGNLENLPQQTSYLQFPPASSEANNLDTFASRSSPPNSKPYMHEIPSDDPNLVTASGSTIDSSSHVSGTRQLPSFTSAQTWQSIPQYGYMKASNAPGGEGYPGWFAHSPNVPSNPQTDVDGMQTEPYAHGAPYDPMYYSDTQQAGRQQ